MFERIKARYQKGWVTVDQLRQFVALGVITSAQFTEICGQAY
jgi:hypothetical protein